MYIYFILNIYNYFQMINKASVRDREREAQKETE